MIWRDVQPGLLDGRKASGGIDISASRSEVFQITCIVTVAGSYQTVLRIFGHMPNRLLTTAEKFCAGMSTSDPSLLMLLLHQWSGSQCSEASLVG